MNCIQDIMTMNNVQVIQTMNYVQDIMTMNNVQVIQTMYMS